MKIKRLIPVIICIVILSGCNTFKNKDSEVDTTILPDTEKPQNIDSTENTANPEKESKPILLPDLTTEQGIREYLVGEWVFDKENISNVVCNMKIDKDLKIHLSFLNFNNKEFKDEYEGQIKFDRIFSENDEAPDLINFELENSDYPGGDYAFLHRTVYDEKRVMSLFYSGNGNGIFDILGSSGNVDSDKVYEVYGAPKEIMFEKVTGEVSQILPRENDRFYGVYWGGGDDDGGSLWMDDVEWARSEEDLESIYFKQMFLYENDVPESVLYSITPEKSEEILWNYLQIGDIHLVQTDEEGTITELKNAEYKRYIEDSLVEGVDSETEDLIFDVLINEAAEVKENLNLGMTILIDGETTTIDGQEYYVVILGTDHEEHFVKEIFYAIDTIEREVYKYDVLNDKWEPMAKG